jgi:hypothetical protein
MSHMDGVTALEVGDPLLVFVCVKADDPTLFANHRRHVACDA